jgi:hypothetical protein
MLNWLRALTIVTPVPAKERLVGFISRNALAAVSPPATDAKAQRMIVVFPKHLFNQQPLVHRGSKKMQFQDRR